MPGVFSKCVLIPVVIAATAGCVALPGGDTETDSDAPAVGMHRNASFTQASSYDETLKLWRNASDVNAWIGARFEYDKGRAIELSETQRAINGRLPIHTPQAFFTRPSGVCVDLARFAVETLREVDAPAQPRYLMIEFDPLAIAGNLLRRHWVVVFQRDGKFYFFADSKRPGHIAGPYADTAEFIAEYARYRGRRVVAFREAESFERQRRSMATRQVRDAMP